MAASASTLPGTSTPATVQAEPLALFGYDRDEATFDEKLGIAA